MSRQFDLFTDSERKESGIVVGHTEHRLKTKTPCERLRGEGFTVRVLSGDHLETRCEEHRPAERTDVRLAFNRDRCDPYHHPSSIAFVILIASKASIAARWATNKSSLFTALAHVVIRSPLVPAARWLP